MKPPNSEYVAPRSFEEAVDRLAKFGGGANVLAGVQSLVPMLKLRFAATDLSAPHSLVNCGVVATSCDAETCDIQPAPDPGMPSNSQRVHTCMLVESGVYIMKSVYLENLVPESPFVAMPIKFARTTDSMLDPVAVVS